MCTCFLQHVFPEMAQCFDECLKTSKPTIDIKKNVVFLFKHKFENPLQGIYYYIFLLDVLYCAKCLKEMIRASQQAINPSMRCKDKLP